MNLPSVPSPKEAFLADISNEVPPGSYAATWRFCLYEEPPGTRPYTATPEHSEFGLGES